jgi:hypothetical protein
MADLSQLEKLKLWLDIPDSTQDAKLQMLLDTAESAIEERRGLPDNPMEQRWNMKQIEIAAYLYNKQGAEGETEHKENGVDRKYESASIPESMLADISPVARVIL